MDPARLDRLARALASPRSRRGALAALATLGLPVTARPAAAKHKHHHPPCLPPGSDLQAAIDAAKPGATLHLCAGVFAGGIDIEQNLTLIGAGADAGGTTLDGGGISRGLSVFGGTVTIRGVVIANGSNGNGFGGGVYNHRALTLVDCVVRLNAAIGGGGIANFDTLTLDGTRVIGNNATGDNLNQGIGGGVYNGGRLTVRGGSTLGGDELFAGNLADAGGGLLNDVDAVATFARGTHVTGNATNGGPGAGAGIFNGGVVKLAAKGIVAGNSPDQCAGPAAVARCGP